MRELRRTCASLLLLAAAMLWTACAELKEPSLVRTHTQEWASASTAGFHGLKVRQAGLISCLGCHGDNYRGGTSGISCNECHNGPGGHPSGWLDKSKDEYHGLRIAAGGPEECAECHGEDYRGLGNKGGSCYSCHNGPSGHPATGWIDRSSDQFHGLKVAAGGLGICTPCHGEDFQGGTSGVFCYKCHNGPSGHPATGWLEKGSSNFHGARYLSQGAAACAVCHGEDFTGGTSGKSCYDCH
ncbi:MAG: hypothetical protein U9P14_02530 [Gemmatimonadota bacterium]|nr:hypothetical protein [Gemmatimonadota bacterium]